MIAQRELSEVTYIVPDMACEHCEAVVSSQLLTIAGVEAVGIDLPTRRVTVYGQELDLGTLQASIEAAGYQAA
jgi:copper chaperone CopZ